MRTTIGLLIGCGLAGLLYSSFFAVPPPVNQELSALKEVVERLQRTVRNHENYTHPAHVEGVWVTGIPTFCAEYEQSVQDGTDIMDYPLPYP